MKAFSANTSYLFDLLQLNEICSFRKSSTDLIEQLQRVLKPLHRVVDAVYVGKYRLTTDETIDRSHHV